MGGRYRPPLTGFEACHWSFYMLFFYHPDASGILLLRSRMDQREAIYLERQSRINRFALIPRLRSG